MYCGVFSLEMFIHFRDVSGKCPYCDRFQGSRQRIDSDSPPCRKCDKKDRLHCMHFICEENIDETVCEKRRVTMNFLLDATCTRDFGTLITKCSYDYRSSIRLLH